MNLLKNNHIIFLELLPFLEKITLQPQVSNIPAALFLIEDPAMYYVFFHLINNVYWNLSVFKNQYSMHDRCTSG